MIRFGTNPIAWANDDDQSLGANIPTEQILREASQIGFDCIENGHRWPDDPQALKELLGSYGLAFVSGWYSLNLLVQSVEEEKKAIQPHLDKLKHNGCRVCIVCETSNSVQGLQAPLSQSRCSRSGDEGLRRQGRGDCCVHGKPGHQARLSPPYGNRGRDTGRDRRLHGGDRSRNTAAFRCGHCYFGGNGRNPSPVLSRYVDRVSHFHAKNVRPTVMRQVRERGCPFMDGVRAGVFTVPGDEEGGVEFEPLLQILKDAGYDGWIVIEAEQDPDIRNPFEYHRSA